MSEHTFEHLIVTRFNLRVEGELPDREWMDHRWDLFDRFTYPSVMAQTNPNFKWVVLFSADTASEDLAKIETYTDPRFRPAFIARYEWARRAAITSNIEGKPSHLIMSRLDNDDAIHEDYIEKVQAEFKGQELAFINFPRGYVWDDIYSRLLIIRIPSNPFISWIQKRKGFRLPYSINHRKVSKHGPLIDVEAPPAWLIVAHGRNRLNWAFGAECPTADLKTRGFAVTQEGA